ncbi:hypothetical protein [Citrobacter telavivensis]|uniref:hypothetical protein n=1 Tax=Citrobacter telavivensis TaxID=2653932 RepID=UPI00359EF381
MKWIFNILVSTAITLMVSPLASGGSFDPVTAAYTTNQITASVTPRTVAASSTIIADGEMVYWRASNGSVQNQGPFYWGPHAYTMNSAAIATTAASGINALGGGCTASASGTSLTINGCFSFKAPNSIYIGRGATCYSFKQPVGHVSSGSLNHVPYIESKFNSSQAADIYPGPQVPIALSSAATTVIFPAVTRQPSAYFTSYNTTLTATVSEKALSYVLFACSVSQGRSVTLNSGSAINSTYSIVTTTNRPTYAPTVTFSPSLPITDNSVVNIRNITAINILPATTFNTGTISSYRTTYTEQPITVTGSGNLTRDVGANENFNVQESWSCTVTGQIDFRIMRDGTQTNLCTSSGYTTHAITAPQSLTAKWRAQSQTSSGAWNATATVTFSLP